MADTVPVHEPASALHAALRSRLLAEPCHQPINDWRHGEVTAERRARMRRFFPDQPVPAAVLVPLVDRDEGLQVLLTQRSAQLKTHAGQISFPGGRVEAGDGGPVDAALRETEEEIGLTRTHVEVIGFLPDHLVISGYRVTPVVALVKPGFDIALDRSEVEEVFEVPLAFVLDERNHVRRIREFEGESIEFTDFPFGRHNIWGATAGMLLTLHRTLRGELLPGALR